jgi:hypothetical protein
MKTRARIYIDMDVSDFDPYEAVIHEMDIEGDAITLSIALLSAGFGMFDERKEIMPQLEQKIIFQKAIATCLLNGTLSMNKEIPEDAIGTLSTMLKKLTDTNILLLEQHVQNQFLTKNDNKDEEGRTETTERTDFSSFS